MAPSARRLVGVCPISAASRRFHKGALWFTWQPSSKRSLNTFRKPPGGCTRAVLSVRGLIIAGTTRQLSIIHNSALPPPCDCAVAARSFMTPGSFKISHRCDGRTVTFKHVTKATVNEKSRPGAFRFSKICKNMCPWICDCSIYLVCFLLKYGSLFKPAFCFLNTVDAFLLMLM